MRSKVLSLVLCAGCLALGACMPVEQQNPVPVVSSSSSSVSVSDGLYVSRALAFTMQLPSGWYLPTSTDTDPHFYETRECSEQDNITCAAFEVQNHDTEFAEGPDAAFQSAASQGLKPQKLLSLIPNATVIATAPEGGAEGWHLEYHIFFPNEKHRFLIFSNDDKLETSIFPTMKPTK